MPRLFWETLITLGIIGLIVLARKFWIRRKKLKEINDLIKDKPYLNF